jgi:hypothetical protein
MNIYIPKDFSEEKCPPEQTITIPSRDKVLEEFTSLLEKEKLQRLGRYTDFFSFLNAKNIYVVTSTEPFKYIKLVCEDRPVTDSFWITDTFAKEEHVEDERGQEKKEQISPLKVVKHWTVNLDILKKKMKPIIVVVIVYLLGMLFLKGLIRGPTRKLLK